MNKQAKSDEEIKAMAISYRGDGATADELAAHEVGFRQAEELHLPIINQQAEEIEELKKLVELLREHNKEITAEVQRKKDGVLAEMQAHNETKREIEKLVANEEALRLQLNEIREAEASVCPEDVGFVEYIQTLTEEIEKLKAELAEKKMYSEQYIKSTDLAIQRRDEENDALQSRFDELTKENEKLMKAGTDALDAYQQEVDDKIELQSRFDELVKENEELRANYHEMKKYASSAVDRETALNIRFDELVKELSSIIPVSGWRSHVKAEEYYPAKDVQSLITKAKGQANGWE